MEIEENHDNEMINIDLGKNQSQQQRRRNNNISFSSTENDAAMLSMSVEEIFQGQAVPGWKEQLTLRAFAVSLVLGFLMSCVVMKLNLTTGIIPSLNVSAGLLGFFMVKMWTKAAGWMGWFRQPFTRQENTIVQTCVVACSGIAFSGGFGSYILAMTKTVADQQQQQHPSRAILTSLNVKELSLGWLIAFLFLVSFVGLFSIVPLRKIMIIDFKLAYPSGTATAHLINSFHTPQGAHLAKKQVSMLFKAFSFSFFWSFFQWFYTGGDDCGFAAFPTFGLKAFANKFYFDFSATYVGVGMICPYIINISLLIGAIISWGILWPFISNKSGVWYDANLDPGSLKGLSGYKVFIPISMILGDGLFNFLGVAFKTLADIYLKYKQKSPALTPSSIHPSSPLTYDDRRRHDFFLKDQIPGHAAVAAYILLSILSLLTVPLIFHQLRPYQILIIYLLAPLLAFCNSYGCGLTDWSLASSYGKIAIFSFGAWAGMSHGGLLTGLAACGVMMSIVSTASDLMQDFKTGYLTLASPRSMFVSQVVGTAMGCVIAPCVFWIFYRSFDGVGKAGSEYPAPYAGVYRGIALIGVQGSEALPKYCWIFCVGFFVAAILLDSFKLTASYYKWRIVKYIPTPMGMAVPFFVGAFFTIDMCIGSLLLFIWEKLDKSHADAFAPAVASGMI